MDRAKRRILELIAILGFGMSLVSIPNSNWKWFFGGAMIVGILLIAAFEFLLVKEENDKQAITADKDERIKFLQAKFEELAVLNDPELLAIHREDERERLRIERESKERAEKLMHQATKSQQETLAQLRRSFIEDIRSN
jgi:cytochrome c-type biogenesis protein CcmH/NrfG